MSICRNSTIGYNATTVGTYWDQYENISEYNGVALNMFERLWAVSNPSYATDKK